LKKISTFVNEKEYKRFKARAEKLQMTPYAVAKKLVKEFLEDQKAVASIVIYGFMFYAYAYMAIVFF